MGMEEMTKEEQLQAALRTLEKYVRVLSERAGEPEDYAEKLWARIRESQGVLQELSYYHDYGKFLCKYQVAGPGGYPGVAGGPLQGVYGPPHGYEPLSAGEASLGLPGRDAPNGEGSVGLCGEDEERDGNGFCGEILKKPQKHN